jgi:hypothetical protein
MSLGTGWKLTYIPRTCFFVISLLSSTRMGAEILEEYGWIATRTPLGVTTGICLPNDTSKFAYVSVGSRGSFTIGGPWIIRTGTVIGSRRWWIVRR